MFDGTTWQLCICIQRYGKSWAIFLLTFISFTQTATSQWWRHQRIRQSKEWTASLWLVLQERLTTSLVMSGTETMSRYQVQRTWRMLFLTTQELMMETTLVKLLHTKYQRHPCLTISPWPICVRWLIFICNNDISTLKMCFYEINCN